jgi:Asp-tRNA(Asn)/Glu-tRNA(Gln) amidotransferase C subunit
MKANLSNRSDVLKYSLEIENLTSQFLGHLLGIHDAINSKTLGNKSSSLSFNNKIDLLIDIGALKGDTKSKFQIFMEIRNQFMHNSYANTYEECIRFLEKEKFLLSRYPQLKDLHKEEQLKNAVKQLSEDVLSMIRNIEEEIINRLKKQADLEMKSKSHSALFESLNEMIEHIDELIKTRANVDPSFAEKDPKYQTIMILTNLWKDKFDKSL